MDYDGELGMESSLSGLSGGSTVERLSQGVERVFARGSLGQVEGEHAPAREGVVYRFLVGAVSSTDIVTHHLARHARLGQHRHAERPCECGRTGPAWPKRRGRFEVA